ncbi:MFS transporter, partial [Candidatus Bathyarchaeota archaeon]|nr:MFS transporter [Candidatus Bathyarchaeota archaeon]
AYRLEEKIGKVNMFLAGSAVMVLASAIAMASSTTLMFSLAFSMYGLGAGILYAAAIALILRWADHARGYGAGLFESLIGVGYLVGSLAGGSAAEYIALHAPYMLALLLSLAVSLFHGIFRLKTRK